MAGRGVVVCAQLSQQTAPDDLDRDGHRARRVGVKIAEEGVEASVILEEACAVARQEMAERGDERVGHR